MHQRIRIYSIAFLICVYFGCATSRSIISHLLNGEILARSQTVETGTFNETMSANVSIENDISFLYTYDYYSDQHWAIYVCVRSNNAEEKAPLIVVVRQSLSVMSWTIPMRLASTNITHSEVCHTLCPLKNYIGPKVIERSQKLFVDFTTSSSKKVNFDLLVSNLTKFLIGTSEHMSFNITPTEPRVLEYHMPPGVRSVLIEAKSYEKKCMILAIQDLQCPFYDSERTVEYKGFYQTMTLQSGITVTQKTFFEGKVYIVMILKPTDYECSGVLPHRRELEQLRMKEVEVTISPSITDKDFYSAVFGALAVFLLLYIFSFIICCFLFVKKRRSAVTEQEARSVCATEPSVQTYGTVSGMVEFSAVSSDETDASNSGNGVFTIDSTNQPARRPSLTSIDETDFDKLPDAERDKNVIRTKTVLFVVDLARKKEKYLSERTKVYSWNLVTVAVFYGLPVVQLVYINQGIINVTGNQDLCYYNFLCSHQSWVFSDFNHVYSNIGYVMLGVLFLLLVWRREVFHSDLQKDADKEGIKDIPGIPHHFGLFYAMGWALIMEGVLSASYHVCPNKANFQFDTAFMYVIATVCMLKLYQARHPDITAKSHQTWMLLSVILLIGVAGVLQGGTLFWLVFVMGHITATFLVSTTIYYMGRWKLDRWIFKRIFQNLKLDFAAGSFHPTYLGRFIMLSLAAVLNVALDLFGLIRRPPNFGAFLLAIFIMNLLLYLIYYTVMKIRYKENIRWIPLMYMFLSFACWAAALHFFLAKNTSWQMTPAGSRERNKHCILLNFYDHHDVWHFFSSCALFFSFMVLFTLDDDLENTPRSAIVVF